jgi:hypothetical protein
MRITVPGGMQSMAVSCGGGLWWYLKGFARVLVMTGSRCQPLTSCCQMQIVLLLALLAGMAWHGMVKKCETSTCLSPVGWNHSGHKRFQQPYH